jgi:serine/threonine protein kinase
MDRMVVQEPLKFDKPGFEKKDPHRKDLLSKMLVKDPKDRIRIEDVIQHPYFDEVIE